MTQRRGTVKRAKSEFRVNPSYKRDVRAKNWGNDEASQIRYRFELYAKGALFDRLAYTFMKGAFLRTPMGFFHGDLHEGNIMLSISDQAYDEAVRRSGNSTANINKHLVDSILQMKDAKGNPLVALTLIDYGNAHELTKMEREGLLNVLFSGSQPSQSARAFLIAFNQLSEIKIDLDSPEGKALEEELNAKAFRPKDKPNRLVQHRLGDAIEILMQHDIPVPSAIIAFFRTVVMLDDSFQELRKDAKKIGLDFEGYTLENETTLALVCPLLRPKVTFVPGFKWACTPADISLNYENLNAMTGGWLGTFSGH